MSHIGGLSYVIRLIDRINTEGERLGLKINTDKTKVMVVSRTPNIHLSEKKTVTISIMSPSSDLSKAGQLRISTRIRRYAAELNRPEWHLQI